MFDDVKEEIRLLRAQLNATVRKLEAANTAVAHLEEQVEALEAQVRANSQGTAVVSDHVKRIEGVVDGLSTVAKKISGL